MSGEGSLAVTVERDVFILAVGAQGPQGPPEDTSGFGTMAVQDADAVAITGGSISVPIVTATTEFRGTVLTSNAASDVALKTSGGTQLNVLHLANAVNYCQARGGAASGRVRFGAAGNDSNIGLNLGSKGSGDVIVTTDAFGYQQFVFSHTANAVNYGATTGAPTGNSIWFSAEGNDTNVQCGFASQGNSPILFRTNSKNGSTQFAVSHEASAVNYMSLYGAISANNPHFNATGSDTNIGISFFGKGAGYLLFDPGGGQGFRVNNAVSAVNSIAVLGAATGNEVKLYAQGSDTNVPIVIQNKGTGNIITRSNGLNSLLITSNATGGTANYFQLYNASASGTPQMGVDGGDTNINFRIFSKGTGYIELKTSAVQMRISDTASAVNYVNVQGAATGFGPTLQFTGSDTDVPSWISTKGTGRLAFAPGGTYEQFRIGVTANAVNHPRVTGGVTGSPAIFGVFGTDTDVDVSIVPQGAGVVRFGTHSALGAEVLSGYITIKDSGGTTRKLAVIS